MCVFDISLFSFLLKIYYNIFVFKKSEYVITSFLAQGIVNKWAYNDFSFG